MSESILKVLHKLDKSFEIIFIDDGSKDGSDKILKSLSEED